MNKVRYSSSILKSWFLDMIVATMPELLKVLGSTVPLTVLRKLKELGYHSSYSHRGKFYTLDELVRFSDLGLWSFQGIHFSRQGTLLDTTLTLITQAKAGYTARELRDILHVEVKQSLLHLQKKGLVVREKDGGQFIYFAPEGITGSRQREIRHQSDEVWANEALKEAIIIFISLLDERQRRLFAGLQSYQRGHGGDKEIAGLFGFDVHTVARGRKELLEGGVADTRIRKRGGGRKKVEKKTPT